MISKNDILKFVRHVYRRGQGIPDRRALHPRREWLIGLFMFMVITAAGAVVSMYFFETYNNIDQRTYTVDLTTPDYNQERAQLVLGAMVERSERYEQLANNARTVPTTPATSTAPTSTPETTTDEEGIEDQGGDEVTSPTETDEEAEVVTEGDDEDEDEGGAPVLFAD